jgi:hypothetical protein
MKLIWLSVVLSWASVISISSASSASEGLRCSVDSSLA